VSGPAANGSGPVVFAYDGSELAKLAIEEAANQLLAGRDALVLTVWQPFDVGFLPRAGLSFDAKQIAQVRDAAEQTAADGSSLAKAAGFRSQSVAVQAAPSWKAIVGVADDRDASLIVLGSHGRNGLSGLFIGSVAAAVAAHSKRSVLIVHRRS
jgi:nucleotide-binding universal stress UspA family protein